ncbi:Tetratricopeptide repeat protein [Novipirellula galeiformis]|uniref:Tetratricopeptide repeat protein n=1 Tax=Novipirellula galeiformis TaxID=2528004 RepID=A0A5C6CNS8_9BACT|nr:BatD family protein [Novipirellula galeiformis]TWU24409.1 Tetratricopeptide repeat protein [Novipirellula galeiformis]
MKILSNLSLNTVFAGWFFVAWVSVCHSAAVAGEVQVELSSQQTYVGFPITLQIEFNNVAKHERPELPELDGLKIESAGVPSRRSQFFSINGRQTQSESITYSFSITPEREGDFVIPALTVSYDGRKELTESLRFSVSKNEVSDLAFAEITGDRPSVYVGESIELTLKIWIKPFHDEAHRVTLSEGDMWSLISNQTDWGPFADRMQELAENRQRPGGELVKREDAEGNPASYYLYEIDAPTYPQRAGSIDGSSCRIVIRYPTELQRSRNPLSDFFDDSFAPFGTRLAITGMRPVIAQAEVAPIEIKSIPTQGRPANYRGAVGKYEIFTQASPKKVKAGDPVTLNIAIRGDGPMDLVQPPPLSEQASLVKDFKVADEALAGLVDGKQKLFTTTIRPLSESVREIPPITFSFFDPSEERFVTVQSEPIAVSVTPADTLSFDNIVANSAPSQADPNQTNANLDSLNGSPQVYPVDELLVSQTPAAMLSKFVWTGIALPPLAFAFTLLLARRGVFIAGLRRWLMPMKQFEKQCNVAAAPTDLSETMRQFLMAHWKLEDADESRLVGHLRRRGDGELAVRLESWFDRCRQAEHGILLSEAGSNAPANLDNLKTEASQLAALCLKRRSKGAAESLRSATRRSKVAMRVMGGFGILTLGLSQPIHATEQSKLNLEQQREILQEAETIYDRGLTELRSDPDQAVRDFTLAATKYQAVVDAGIERSKLYYNLGHSYRRSGSMGLAVASYRRAILLDPDNPALLIALRDAQREFASANSAAEMQFNRRTLTQQIVALLFSWVPRYWVLWSAILAWGVAWVIIARGALARHPTGWSSAIACMLLAVALGGSVWAHEWSLRDPEAAIVVVADAGLRSVDDERVAIEGPSLRETSEVIVRKRRGDWVKVTTPDHRTGWLRRTDIR